MVNRTKKAKTKERSSGEYYRSQIRDLEKQVRSLQRQLKYYEKQEHNMHKLPDEPEEKEDAPIYCPSCRKGHIDVVVVANRSIINCKLCGFRKVEKIV